MAVVVFLMMFSRSRIPDFSHTKENDVHTHHRHHCIIIACVSRLLAAFLCPTAHNYYLTKYKLTGSALDFAIKASS